MNTLSNTQLPRASPRSATCQWGGMFFTWKTWAPVHSSTSFSGQFRTLLSPRQNHDGVKVSPIVSVQPHKCDEIDEGRFESRGG